MLKIIKRHHFIFWFLSTVLIFGWNVLNSYLNGQAIASAHLDGHYSASMLNMIIASILTVIFVVLFLRGAQRIIKWFSIPAIIAVFAFIHSYIATLFDCCVCCCHIPYIHQWNRIILGIIATVIFATVIISLYVIENLCIKRGADCDEK